MQAVYAFYCGEIGLFPVIVVIIGVIIFNHFRKKADLHKYDDVSFGIWDGEEHHFEDEEEVDPRLE